MYVNLCWGQLLRCLAIWHLKLIISNQTCLSTSSSDFTCLMSLSYALMNIWNSENTLSMDTFSTLYFICIFLIFSPSIYLSISFRCIRSILPGWCSPCSVEGDGAWRRREPTSAGEPRAPHSYQPWSEWPPSGKDKPSRVEWQSYRATQSPQWSSAETSWRYDSKSLYSKVLHFQIFHLWYK